MGFFYMNLLNKLQKNKGTVSSALGKELAKAALNGEYNLISEAAELLVYEPDNIKAKNVRAGAAKIIEKIAEEKPDLVTPHFDKLISALEMPEPQTKWMAIRTIGFLAKLKPESARKAIPYAKKFYAMKAGVCLSGATSDYLGRLGAISAKEAKMVFPLLENALNNAETNEVDWVLEAYLRMFLILEEKYKTTIVNYARKYLKAPKKSTIKRAEKIIRMGEKETPKG